MACLWRTFFQRGLPLRCGPCALSVSRGSSVPTAAFYFFLLFFFFPLFCLLYLSLFFAFFHVFIFSRHNTRTCANYRSVGTIRNYGLWTDVSPLSSTYIIMLFNYYWLFIIYHYLTVVSSFFFQLLRMYMNPTSINISHQYPTFNSYLKMNGQILK